MGVKKLKKTETEFFVVDENKKLTFKSEEEVLLHFRDHIEVLEDELVAHKKDTDVESDVLSRLPNCLELTLGDPKEVWLDRSTLPEVALRIYFRDFELDKKKICVLALAYTSQGKPTFIYLYFPTQDEELIERYRRGLLIFKGSLEKTLFTSGDALSEGDILAGGLYDAMTKVRSSHDIPEEDFSSYIDYRDVALETPDEVYRYTDSRGHVIVHFIKEFSKQDQHFFYLVVTSEENLSESHFLLFSFPTKDASLVDRFRHGESLHTDDFVKADSH
jgi:hypothetical protein